MLIPRRLAERLRKSKKSVLLLGPRQTGKSTLIQQLNPALTINLANEQTYLAFAGNPAELEQRLASRTVPTVFIDEIQRLPSLLNTLQDLMDGQFRHIKFYLTGSSARKLKRGGANLLPGRLHTYHLGPLAAGELDYRCDAIDGLAMGTLPGIYIEPSADERQKTLRSYSATYLKEEIQAEALTRNIEGFSRFLFVAAACSGQFLDLTKLASEGQIARQSAMRYFEILEDTLIVNRCEAFAHTVRQRLIRHPKYYFFDTGVLNALLGNFGVSADRKGLLFEHLFFNQLIAGVAAADIDCRISTYRTQHGVEVDFIFEHSNRTWAIECKASTNVGPADLRGLRHFAADYRRPLRTIVAYLGTVEKQIEDVAILPWQTALREMGL
ncbi:MAG: ATP-binding protein [Deltaproteobacteria bacterium]|nr:ATP-binding protein [Deltaproteobacteria bacterium]